MGLLIALLILVIIVLVYMLMQPRCSKMQVVECTDKKGKYITSKCENGAWVCPRNTCEKPESARGMCNGADPVCDNGTLKCQPSEDDYEEPSVEYNNFWWPWRPWGRFHFGGGSGRNFHKKRRFRGH